MITFKQPKEHILLVEPKFNLDISNIENLSSMKEKILQFISENNINIIIFDFKFCNFIDSSGLGQLLKIYDAVYNKNGKILVCNIDKNIKNFFDITNLNNYFIPQKNCDNMDKLIEKL